MQQSRSQQSVTQKLTVSNSQISNQGQRITSGTVFSSGIVENRRDSFHEKGFHKRFMGNDLDVVCFLMSVEMERLYDEVHQWRSKYEKIHQGQVDQSHYERIIEELNAHNYELEAQLGERSRLEEKITMISSEMDKWRREALDRGEQISSFKIIKEQLEGRLISYEQEHKRLRTLLEGKDRDLDSLSERCTIYESNIAQLETELRVSKSWEIKARDLQSIIESKDREIQDQRNRYGELIRQYDSLRQLEQKIVEVENRNAMFASENDKLIRTIDVKNQDIESWRKKYSQIEIELAHYRQFEGRVQEYENRFSLMATEIERLKGLLHQRLQEIEEHKRNILELQDNIRSHSEKHRDNDIIINQHSNRISQLTEHLSSRNETMEQLRNHVDRLEQTVRIQENKIQEYESRIVSFTAEIDRYNQLLELRSKDIEQWKQKHSKLEIALVNYRGFEDKCREQEQRIQLLLSQIEDFRGRIIGQEKLIYNLRIYESRCIDYENKIPLLTQEIERLNDVIRVKLQDIEEWRNRNSSLEIQMTKIKTYEGKIIEYENRIALLTNEIDRLNQILKNKVNECDEWKSKFTHIEISFSSNESRVKELEGRIIMLSGEIERLTVFVKDKNNEMEEWRSKFYRSSDQISEYEKKFSILQRERESLNSILREKSEEIESWKLRVNKLTVTISNLQDLEDTVRILNDEIDRLSEELNMLKRENSDLKQYYVERNSLEIRLQDNLCLSVTLFAEVESLRARLKEKERDVEEIRRSSLAPYRESRALKSQTVTTTYSTNQGTSQYGQQISNQPIGSGSQSSSQQQQQQYYELTGQGQQQGGSNQAQVQYNTQNFRYQNQQQ